MLSIILNTKLSYRPLNQYYWFDINKIVPRLKVWGSGDYTKYLADR